jgi:hypothetical protein
MTTASGRRVKVKIEIEAALLEEITAAEIKRMLASLQRDYKLRKEGKWMAIFDTDKTKDLAELKRHIEAFKLVGRYYGVKV